MAAKRSHVRVVSPDEKPAKPKVLTLHEAVESGDYLDILLAQRREIVSSLPDERGPAKAALHRQLALISKEIESLRAVAEESEVGDEPVDDTFDASVI